MRGKRNEANEVWRHFWNMYVMGEYSVIRFIRSFPTLRLIWGYSVYYMLQCVTSGKDSKIFGEPSSTMNLFQRHLKWLFHLLKIDFEVIFLVLNYILIRCTRSIPLWVETSMSESFTCEKKWQFSSYHFFLFRLNKQIKPSQVFSSNYEFS